MCEVRWGGEGCGGVRRGGVGWGGVWRGVEGRGVVGWGVEGRGGVGCGGEGWRGVWRGGVGWGVEGRGGVGCGGVWRGGVGWGGVGGRHNGLPGHTPSTNTSSAGAWWMLWSICLYHPGSLVTMTEAVTSIFSSTAGGQGRRAEKWERGGGQRNECQTE